MGRWCGVVVGGGWVGGGVGGGGWGLGGGWCACVDSVVGKRVSVDICMGSLANLNCGFIPRY